MATQTQTPPASAPPSTEHDEAFEFTLDEALDLGEETPSEEVVTPETPAQPLVVPPPAVAPEVVAPKGDLKKALKEERRKKREIRGQWQQVLADRDRLLGELGRGRPVGPVTVDPARLAALKEKAEKVSGFGEHAELVLGEVQTLLADTSRQYADLLYRERLAWQEGLVKFQHKDFDSVLEQAKIWEGLQLINGQYKDPALAKSIYESSNPSLKAYELAIAKIEYEKGEVEDDDEPETPAPPVTPTNTQPVVAVVNTEVEAERRGAKGVVEKVVAHAAKPQGIRNLRDAGTPNTQKITRKQLDDLSERNQDQFLKVMKGNPTLEKWYYS